MNSDDPKFTAYALGETDELTAAECAEIETLLAADPAAKGEAEELRGLGGRLRTELQTEAGIPLRKEQHAAVLQAATDKMAKAKVIRFPRWATALTAAAACVIVASSVAVFWTGLVQRKSWLSSSTMAARLDGPMDRITDGETEKIPDSATAPVVAAPSPSATPLPTDVAQRIAAHSKDWAKGGTAHASEPPIKADESSATGVPEGSISVHPSMQFAAGGNVATVPQIPVLQPMATPSGRAYASSQPSAGVFHTASTASPLPPGSPPVAVPVDTRSLAHLNVTGNTRTRDKVVRRELPVDQIELVIHEEPQPEEPTTESYDPVTDNGFLTVEKAPLSTFSTDVDTASYAIVRRFLNDQRTPPKNAVRIEELLNYFSYNYPLPAGDAPFSATMEVAGCPWAPEHRLVRIGLRGREIAKDQRPPSNLVFLIDVSGSMMPANKLPLLKQSLLLLIDQLGEKDQVAMVVYAGNSGCVLEPTHDKAKMRAALGRLEAGGSTNGASGIQLAYRLAEESFIKGGTNRVILATDGDWNVGVTDPAALFDLIARKAKSNVFLTVLGVGMDNLQDSMLVKLADKGNGNYAYIDTLLEAKKVFVEQLTSTLVTIAKDVKIQVEFNPAQVGAYRLIGYEKRMLAKEDFNNDQKDAGEIGAGHTVTALYEIVPAGQDLPGQTKPVDALKYQSAVETRAPVAATPAPVAGEIRREMLTLKLRYKEPEGDTSKLLEFPLTDSGLTLDKSTADFRFAAAVASYGMLLRDSADKGRTTWSSTLELAREGLGEDHHGYRAEFLSLIEKARALER